MIDRYDIDYECIDFDQYQLNKDIDPDGEWVKYEDHINVLKEIKDEIDDLMPTAGKISLSMFAVEDSILKHLPKDEPIDK